MKHHTLLDVVEDKKIPIKERPNNRRREEEKLACQPLFSFSIFRPIVTRGRPPSAASFSEGFNNHLALPWIRRRDWWSSNMAKMRKHHHHPYPFDKMKNYSLENTPPFSSWGRKEESLKTVAMCYRKCTSCQCAVLASSPQTWRKVILLHAKSFFFNFFDSQL